MLGRPVDPVLARGLLRMINTLLRPDELMSDADFLGRIASHLAGPDIDPTQSDALRVPRSTLLGAAAA
jgi:hypothetical protein